MEERKKESVETEREKKRKAVGEEMNQSERKKRKLESMLAYWKKMINWPLIQKSRIRWICSSSQMPLIKSRGKNCGIRS